jgi:hypothetical protein
MAVSRREVASGVPRVERNNAAVGVRGRHISEGQNFRASDSGGLGPSSNPDLPAPNTAPFVSSSG